MNRPKDYKFEIADYGDGPVFDFYHDDPGNCEVWDDHDKIIQDNLPDWLIRLEESCYKPTPIEIGFVTEKLLNLGFEEK